MKLNSLQCTCDVSCIADVLGYSDYHWRIRSFVTTNSNTKIQNHLHNIIQINNIYTFSISHYCHLVKGYSTLNYDIIVVGHKFD